MLLLAKGKYRARIGQGERDLTRAQELRHQSFLARRGLARAAGRDADGFDAACAHVLVEDIASGALVCCFRLMQVQGAAEIAASYSAQVYHLDGLARLPGPMLELGRFCLHPDWHDPDILRLAWGALTRLVDQGAIKVLFGCSSFAGCDPARHRAALAGLAAHIAPADRLPGRKAAEIYPLAEAGPADPRATLALPSLLRTYLAMGGWVSDHAVIDRDLDTLHVFTAVEIDRIPAARARALRAIAE